MKGADFIVLACGVAGIVLACLWAYLEVIRPFVRIRDLLRRLSEKDFHPVPLEARLGIFSKTITHIRRISELLQRLDKQAEDEDMSLRAILSSMVEGVMITDRTMRIRLANDTLAEMFSIRHSPINRSVMEVFRNHKLQETLEQTFVDGQPQKMEFSIQTPDGNRHEAKFFEVHASPLNSRNRGRPIGSVVVIHDITTIKNLEEIRREFVANVSHEFRTPLSVINGYVETLLDGAIDDRVMAEHALKVMLKNGRRLKLLIDDLLTIARLEGGGTNSLEFHPADLREGLDRVLDVHGQEITANKTDIRIDWDVDAREAEVDISRIEETFSNLLGNALRYGASGDPVITIRALREGDDIKITFQDNGPGIPLDDQPHIFERFYRVHKDRSRHAGGTGLGLSIVKTVVSSHGGRVAVESAPGAGAAFHLSLPVRQVANPAQETQSARI